MLWRPRLQWILLLLRGQLLLLLSIHSLLIVGLGAALEGLFVFGSQVAIALELLLLIFLQIGIVYYALLAAGDAAYDL